MEEIKSANYFKILSDTVIEKKRIIQEELTHNEVLKVLMERIEKKANMGERVLTLKSGSRVSYGTQNFNNFVEHKDILTKILETKGFKVLPRRKVCSFYSLFFL